MSLPPRTMSPPLSVLIVVWLVAGAPIFGRVDAAVGESVKYANGDLALAAELLLPPAGQGSGAGAVILQGSGVYGSEDERDNVPVTESVRRLEFAFGASGNTDAQIVVIDGAGHSLRDPATGELHTELESALASWLERHSFQVTTASAFE